MRQLFYQQKPQFTGWIAYRGAVEVPHPFDGKTMMILGAKNGIFFECFPYVCPEPVLAKASFIYINGSKMPFFPGRVQDEDGRVVQVKPLMKLSAGCCCAPR